LAAVTFCPAFIICYDITSKFSPCSSTITAMSFISSLMRLADCYTWFIISFFYSIILRSI